MKYYLLILFGAVVVSLLLSCTTENHLQRKADKTGECQRKPATRKFPKGFY